MESSQPSMDIFYRTFAKDVPWLAYSLRSVAKYAKGFRKIVIGIPEEDFHTVSHLTREVIHILANDGRKSGYLTQQITKLHADEYCEGSYVCHMDSDTVFTSEVTPAILMPKGKPVILYEDFNAETGIWIPVVEKCLGWKPKYEFMRRHPFVYPRWAYSEFRAWFKKERGGSIDDYVMMQPGHLFSEFNVMGAFLWETHRDDIDWRKPDDMPVFVRQFWSWGGIDTHRDELEKLLD